MLLLSCFFIISVVFARETRINDHVVKIENDGNIEAIEWTEKSSKELNLSNLNITSIGVNAFPSSLSYLEILDLSRNELRSLPETIFVYLTNLRDLSLANNKLSQINGAFVGLNNLKNLDLSHNRLDHITTRGSFFGLNESCIIVVDGNEIVDISYDEFESPSPYLDRDTDVNYVYSYEWSKSENNFTTKDGRDWSAVRLMVCLKDNVSVEQVGFVSSNESLPTGCKTTKVSFLPRDSEYTQTKRYLNFDRMGIERFEKGWYRLENYPLYGIALAFNEITNLTSQMLNELPENIKFVDLSYNKIETLKNCTIENEHLWELHLDENSISHIDDGTFAKTKLKILSLQSNILHSTKFAKTLPTTLTELKLSNNNISNLIADSFEKLGQLIHLNLDENNIIEISERSFYGLLDLETLQLSSSNVKSIAPGAFGNLTKLKHLDLSNNKIAKLGERVFEGLKNLRILYLDHNELKKITRKILAKMINLEALSLAHNHISSLEHANETVTNGSSIENEKSPVFNLSKLESLDLCDNKLREIKKEYFDGLISLRYLDICNNTITKIGKNFGQTTPKLFFLNLNNNHIASLETGTFADSPMELSLRNNEIAIIASGTFRLPNLKHLDLSRNKLSHLETNIFANLTNLEYLSLADNVIPTIPSGMLKYSHKLGYLDLSGNMFEILENGAFCGLKEVPELIHVDVTDVPLKSIQAGLFSAKYCSIVSE